jgi:drug/metabolite transporter (DMT)-like permease
MRGILAGPEPALFLVLAAVWGSSYLAVEVAGDSLPPFTLVALRLAVGTTALLVVARLRHVARPTRSIVPHLFAVGALGIVIPFSLITAGEHTIDAGLASIIVATAPLLTAALVGTGVGGGRDGGLGRVGEIGLLVGFGGVLLVAGGGVGSGLDPMGMLLLGGAAAAYAANGLYARRFLTGVPPMTIATGQAMAALTVTIVLAVVVDGIPGSPPAVHVVGALVWLGLLSSAVGPIIYFRLIAAWGPTRTTTVNYLTPVVGVVGGALLLGDRIPPATMVGGALIVAGVAMANLPRSGADRLLGGLARWATPARALSNAMGTATA